MRLDINWPQFVLGCVVVLLLLTMLWRGRRGLDAYVHSFEPLHTLRDRPNGARLRPHTHVLMQSPVRAVDASTPTCNWIDVPNYQQLQQCSGVCDGATNMQTCVASCAAGTAFAGALEGQQQVTFTCVAGQWSGPAEPPSCVPPAVECPALAPNGVVGMRFGSVCVGAEDGDTCFGMCPPGMYPSGPSQTTCVKGAWSNPLCCIAGESNSAAAATGDLLHCIMPDGSYQTLPPPAQ